MSTQITNHKCLACTGPLHFVGTSGKLECDYCGSSFTIEEIEKFYQEEEEKATESFIEEERKTEKNQDQQWESTVSDEWGADGEKMKAYGCPSCGAQLICDETTAATSCPYCGNPTVVPGQFAGTLKPDYIIPFKLEKQAAIDALKKYYKGKRFLPSAFAADNKINEMKGVYVPFWLFDGVAEADVSYHATTSSTRRSGDEEITTTKHYDVRRAGSLAFEKVPVDASSKMPDNHMDSIEPFDYKELKDFSTAYLPGYLADKYDVDKDQCAPRADERCKNSVLQAMRDTVTGYHTVIEKNSSVELERGKVSYALLPVWMLHTKWNGKDYLFAMNGQTGRLIGDLPVSWKKFWLHFFGISLPLMIIFAIITLFT